MTLAVPVTVACLSAGVCPDCTGPLATVEWDQPALETVRTECAVCPRCGWMLVRARGAVRPAKGAA
jgi:hypothetical protein